MIAARLEDSSNQGSYVVLVLGHENGLGPAERRSCRRNGGRRLSRPRNAREVDLERRPNAELTIDPDVTTRLLDDPIHRRQSQPGPLSSLLGCEERLEHPRPGFG